jgi:hypothetical protein
VSGPAVRFVFGGLLPGRGVSPVVTVCFAERVPRPVRTAFLDWMVREGRTAEWGLVQLAELYAFIDAASDAERAARWLDEEGAA